MPNSPASPAAARSACVSEDSPRLALRPTSLVRGVYSQRKERVRPGVPALPCRPCRRGRLFDRRRPGRLGRFRPAIPHRPGHGQPDVGAAFRDGIVATTEDFGLMANGPPIRAPSTGWRSISVRNGLEREAHVQAARQCPPPNRQSSRITPDLLEKDPHKSPSWPAAPGSGMDAEQCSATAALARGGLLVGEGGAAPASNPISPPESGSPGALPTSHTSQRQLM